MLNYILLIDSIFKIKLQYYGIILQKQVQFPLHNEPTNQRLRRDITPDALAAYWTLCSKTITSGPIGSVSRSDDCR